MSLLIVGSVAYDSIETPFGTVNNVLGGSAFYSSLSASFFSKINLVAVVGTDFDKKEIEFLNTRGIDTKGLVVADGNTFAWKGKYSYDLNEAHTIDTKLNVFQDFSPNLPDEYKDTEYVFLGNIDPELQLHVISQIKSPKFTAIDTMNHWINEKKEDVIKVMSKVSAVIINESEAKQLSGEYNILKAAQTILNYGAKYLVIKRGEYGVLLFDGDHVFSLPAFPLEVVKDPTGAGDSFAGGFMGYLAKENKFDMSHLRQAVVIGTVMASINVEDFSVNRFKEINNDDINIRLKEFKKVLHFEEII